MRICRHIAYLFHTYLQTHHVPVSRAVRAPERQRPPGAGQDPPVLHGALPGLGADPGTGERIPLAARALPPFPHSDVSAC